MSQITDKLYTGSVWLGKTTATIKLVGFTILAALIFIGGVWILLKKKTEKITANVITAYPCLPKSVCKIDISYRYKDVDYTKLELSVSNAKNYKTGDIINVYIDPSDPTSVSESSSKTMAWVLIIIAILIEAGVLLNWWLTRKSDFYAGVQGAGTGFGIASNVASSVPFYF